MCVSTFRDPRIMGYMLLPAAFRSLSRLSSALSAKASTLRSYWLNLLCRPMVLVASFSNKYKSLHSRLLLKITFLGCLVIKQLLSNRILILYAVFKVRLTDRINQSFKTPNSFPLSYAIYTWNPETLFDFFKFWRPPVLPCRLQHSTFGRPALHGRVRDGNGCFLRTHRHQKH
jgi:hypothetical protein